MIGRGDFREIADTAQVQLLSRSNSTVLVIVTGFADGIPNNGLRFKLDTFPAACVRNIPTPVRDPELAALRACVVREQISALTSSSKLSIVWDNRVHDEPIGGKVGKDYRAVHVEVTAR